MRRTVVLRHLVGGRELDGLGRTFLRDVIGGDQFVAIGVNDDEVMGVARRVRPFNRVTLASRQVQCRVRLAVDRTGRDTNPDVITLLIATDVVRWALNFAVFPDVLAPATAAAGLDIDRFEFDNIIVALPCGQSTKSSETCGADPRRLEEAAAAG